MLGQEDAAVACGIGGRRSSQFVGRVASVPDAINHAIATARPDEVICIAGSLYVVGEARQMLDLSGRIN